MAPHKFWLKRQIDLSPILGGGDDDTDNDSNDGPAPGANQSSSASVNVQSSSSTQSQSSSSPSNTPTPSSVSSTPAPSSSSAPGAVETPASSTTPLGQALPSNPTPSSLSNEQLNIRSTSTFIESRTLVVEGAANSGISNNKVGASSQNDFLDNKVLSGVVFGLCGLVGLILIITIGFFVTRKARRNRKLESEIISWDPDHVQTFHKKDEDGRSIQDLEEKGRLSPSSQQGHYTYTLPSKSQPTNNNSTVPPYPAYGQPVPIHVALPANGGSGQQQSYRPPW